MHQIQFRLGLRSRTCWGAYSASSDPLDGFKGPTSKGRGGKGERMMGESKGGQRRKSLPPPFQIPGCATGIIFSNSYLSNNRHILKIYYTCQQVLPSR